MFFYIILTFLISQSSLALENFKDESFKIIKLGKTDEIIWGMDFLDQNNLILTCKESGSIQIFNLEKKEFSLIYKIQNLYNKGQGGLLDIKKSPFHQSSNFFYLTYSEKNENKGEVALASIEIDQNLKAKNFNIIQKFKTLTSKTVHFGSRIAFNPSQQEVYISIGERGIRENAQDLKNHAGKILRYKFDKITNKLIIPTDNPFINQKDALPEIYSYGHRNPQGIYYHQEKNQLYSVEHGPRGGDELNLIQKKLNYGWPIISYGKEYYGPFQVGVGVAKKGLEQPLYEFTPSIATSSLLIYSGKKFKNWKDLFFITGLKSKAISVLYSKNHKFKEERFLEKIKLRLRNIIESPNGEIIISTDQGNLIKITK